jgi:hypothetical protein
MGVFPLRVDGGIARALFVPTRDGEQRRDWTSDPRINGHAGAAITGVAVNGPAGKKFYYFFIGAMIKLKYQ